MKIDGKNYQVKNAASEIALSELTQNQDGKAAKFFNIFDTEGGKADGKLSKAEISNALQILQNWSEGKKADDKLTGREIRKALKKYPELKGMTKKEAKEFIKAFLSLNEQKLLAEALKAEQEAENAQNAGQTVNNAQNVQNDQAIEVRKTEEEEKVAEQTTYDYVVPEGQSFKALLKKVLIAQGKKEAELTDEDYKQAEEQFKADNPDIEIRGNKVKYLLAGEKVKVSVDFGEELADSAVEQTKWSQKIERRRQAQAKKTNAPEQKAEKKAEPKSENNAAPKSKTVTPKNAKSVNTVPASIDKPDEEEVIEGTQTPWGGGVKKATVDNASMEKARKEVLQREAVDNGTKMGQAAKGRQIDPKIMHEHIRNINNISSGNVMQFLRAYEKGNGAAMIDIIQQLARYNTPASKNAALKILYGASKENRNDPVILSVAQSIESGPLNWTEYAKTADRILFNTLK